MRFSEARVCVFLIGISDFLMSKVDSQNSFYTIHDERHACQTFERVTHPSTRLSGTCRNLELEEGRRTESDRAYAQSPY